MPLADQQLLATYSMQRTYSAKMGYTAADHLLRVNGVVALGLAASSYGVKMHLDGTMPGGDHMTLAQVVLGALIGVGHSSVQTDGISLWRLAALVLFGLCAGANVGTWLEAAMQETGFCVGTGFESLPDMDWFGALFGGKTIATKAACSEFIWQGLAGTASLYFAFAFGSFVAALSRGGKSLMWLTSFVSVGLWIMNFTYVFARLGWTSYETFELVYVQMGLAFYCVKIAVDTQIIITKFEKENDNDVVSHALTMLLNILHVFIRLITIMAKEGSKKKTR